MTLRIAPVRSRRDWRLFRDLAARLYGDRPQFVPVFRMAFATLMDRKRNPFWAQAQGQEWLAFRDGTPVGRIGACVDNALTERAPGTGVVGLYECAEDGEVSQQLFGTAETWLKEQGCTRARGPLNYSIHDTGGLLVDGFEPPPVHDTTWNPEYYQGLWEAAGYVGAKDTLAAAGDVIYGGPDRIHRFADLARKRGVTIRGLRVKDFDADVDAARRVYNAAWDGNWGHVPVSKEEFAFKAKDLKSVLEPALLWLAELEGQVVGFFLGLPDFNVLVKLNRGKLFPLGWWRLLRARKYTTRCRVIAMGVVPGCRVRGVDALMIATAFKAMRGLYDWAEASWVLEENKAMMNNLALYNLLPYKRWRIYEKEL